MWLVARLQTNHDDHLGKSISSAPPSSTTKLPNKAIRRPLLNALPIGTRAISSPMAFSKSLMNNSIYMAFRVGINRHSAYLNFGILPNWSSAELVNRFTDAYS